VKARQWLLLAGILILTVVSYLPALRGDFTSDEYILVLDNPGVQHPENLRAFFSDKFWTGKARGIFYRPLITASYALDWRLWKTNPLGYHMFNLAFCLGAVVLFFGLARKFTPGSALLAAAVFAFHPLHSEAVAWIPGRTDLLAGFFMLGAWLLWMKADGPSQVKRIMLYVATAICTLLALMSKEIAIILPVLFFITDWWRSEKGSGITSPVKNKMAGYLLLGAVLAFYLWLRHSALSGPGPEPARPFMSGAALWEKPLFISRVWLEYLWLMVFPHPLRMDAYYTLKFATGSYPVRLCLVSGLFWVLAIIWMALGLARRNIMALLLLFWLVSLAPVSHLIPFPTAMAVRFAFAPTIFFALAAGVLISGVSKTSPALARVAGAAVVVFLFILSMSANANYQDRFKYLRNVVKDAPEWDAGHNQLGLAAFDRGWLDYADREFRWAINISPNYPEAMLNLSRLKLKTGDAQGAIDLLQKTISLNPDYDAAYYNLGLTLKNLDRTGEAMQAFEKASKLNPENPGPLCEQAEILFGQGKTGDAKTLADRALALAGWNLPALKLRIKIAIQEQDRERAEALLKKAENIYPGDPGLIQLRNSLSR
jgi:protein O-mannosyl-transferase